MKILIVEDEPLISLWIEETLIDAGYEVLTADNAGQAIAILERDPSIRLVFTDVDMPGPMDGLMLADLVRNRWPPLHIIIASGKHRPTKTQMPDFATFLSKPYDAETVLDAIRGYPMRQPEPAPR